MHNISSKLATLAIALMMNALMIGGIAYLFNLELHQTPSAVAASGLADEGTKLA